MVSTGNHVTYKFMKEAGAGSFSGLEVGVDFKQADAFARGGMNIDGISSFNSVKQFQDIEILLQADDTSTITTGVGDQVTQWDDKSGNGHHAVQAVGADQPLTNQETLNALNVLTFNTHFMEIPFAAGVNPTEFTAIAVAKTDLAAAASGYYTNIPGITQGGFTFFGSTNYIAVIDDDTAFAVIVSFQVFPIDGNWIITAFRHRQIPYSELLYSGLLDGENRVTLLGYDTNRAMQIGRAILNAVSNTMDGGFAEFRFWSKPLNDARISANVEDLRKKWGL